MLEGDEGKIKNRESVRKVGTGEKGIFY